MPVQTLTNDTFQSIVRDAGRPVLVDFSAAWCPPCQMLKPELTRAAETLAGTADVAIVDVDAESALAGEFNVTSIPALKLFVGGEIVAEAHGFQNHDALVAWVERSVAAAA